MVATHCLLPGQHCRNAGHGFAGAQAAPLLGGEAVGVSGFAFQGTNAHTILAPLEEPAKGMVTSGKHCALLPPQALSKEGLRAAYVVHK